MPRGLPEWAFRLYIIGVPPGAVGFVADPAGPPATDVLAQRIERLEAGYDSLRAAARLLLTAVDNLAKRARP